MKKIWHSIVLVALSLEVGAWTPLAPGWNYEKRDLKNAGEAGEGPTAVHLFRIDPAKVRIDILLSSDYSGSALPAIRYRERSGAALVINGGFFDEAYRSLGLLVRKGAEVNPLRKADWGVFIVSEKGAAAIVHRRDFRKEGVVAAIQVGPRLVVEGKIPSLKETVPARRSALGVTAQGEILVALSEASIGLREWAALLQKEASSAINLDGGGSSQISVRLKDFALDVSGETGVPNAVAFRIKNSSSRGIPGLSSYSASYRSGTPSSRRRSRGRGPSLKSRSG